MKSIWLMALVAGLITAACSSVHIQTGPPTDAEFTARSQTQAQQFKTEWYAKLDQADGPGKVALLNSLINQTATGYIKYGRNVADTWQRAAKDAGVAVHSSEILKMVEQSTANDQPMIQAHTDVVEFGMDEAIRTGNFGPDDIDLLNDYRDFFNDVYNGVFLPSGEVENYIQNLDELEARQATLYDRVLRELGHN